MIPELLIVALDFYRDPHRFSHLTKSSSPLPAGITELLAAPGDALSAEKVEQTASTLLSSVDDCQQALPFFIRQVLLENEGDYYRILGVPRTAENTLIKRHYQYLMRLFHPDRDVNDDKWDDLYAPLINEAYSTLRNPQKRREYDAKLESESRSERGMSSVQAVGAAYMQKKPNSAAPPQNQKSPPLRPESTGIPPHVKKASMWLLVIVIVGFVLLVVVQARKPTLRMDEAGQPGFPREQAPRASLAAGEEKPVEEKRTVAAALEAEPSPTVEEMVRSRVRQAEQEVLGLFQGEKVAALKEHSSRAIDDGEELAIVVEQAREGMAAVEEVGEPSPVAQTGPTPPQTKDNSPVALVPGSEAIARRPLPETPPEKESPPIAEQSIASAPESVTRSETPPSAIANEALSALLSSLVASYEAGDVDEFTGLFSQDATTTDADGAREIYTLYQQYFGRQDVRKMEVSNFIWSVASGDVMSGTGNFLIITKPRSGGKEVRAVIGVSLDIRKYADGLKITRMFYKPSEQ